MSTLAKRNSKLPSLGIRLCHDDFVQVLIFLRFWLIDKRAVQISVLLGYTELWIAIIFRKKEIECIETIPLRENCWKNDLEVVSYNQNIMYILYMYHNTCTINNDLLKKTCCIIGHHSLFYLVKKDFCSHSVSLLPSFDKITACHLVQSYQMSKHYISIWFLVCKWIFTDLFQLWYKINLRFESFCKNFIVSIGKV